MRRFVEGIDRDQATLFPEYLEDSIDADNPVRGIKPNAPIASFIKRLRCQKCGSQSVRAERLAQRKAS